MTNTSEMQNVRDILDKKSGICDFYDILKLSILKLEVKILFILIVHIFEIYFFKNFKGWSTKSDAVFAES